MSDANDVEIDVLVVCQHDAAMVKRCLTSAKEGARNKVNLWVWLNGDGTWDEARPAGSVALMLRDLIMADEGAFAGWRGSTDNAGFIPPNNALARLGTAPYICLLNADTISAPGWDVPLVEAITTATDGLYASIAGYGGALLGRDMVGMMQGQGWAIDYIEGWCLMTTRGAWEALGGFDEEHLTLAYGEDSDLCLRAKEAGYGVVAVENRQWIDVPSAMPGHQRASVGENVRHLGGKGATEGTRRSPELQQAFAANHAYLRERHKAYLESGRVLVKGYRRPYLRVKTFGGGTDYTAQPALAASLIGPDSTAEHVNVHEVDGRLWQLDLAGMQPVRFLLP